MRNLLQETLGKLGVDSTSKTAMTDAAKKILWAKVTHGSLMSRFDFDEEPEDEPSSVHFSLQPEHSLEEAIEFLKSLDFEYDNGYGTQEVFGTIMLNNSTWLERGEYDGSEWWERRSIPTWN